MNNMQVPDFNTKGLFDIEHTSYLFLSDVDCAVLIDGKELCHLKKDIPASLCIENCDHVFSFIHEPSGSVQNIKKNKSIKSNECIECKLSNLIQKQVKEKKKKEEQERKAKIESEERIKANRRKWWHDNGDNILGVTFLICCALCLLSLVIIIGGWLTGSGHAMIWNVCFWSSLVCGSVNAFVLECGFFE